MIKLENGELVNVGLNGSVKEGTSKSGKTYMYYDIYWVHPSGKTTQVKQVFLSDLELQMLEILQNQLIDTQKS